MHLLVVLKWFLTTVYLALTLTQGRHRKKQLYLTVILHDMHSLITKSRREKMAKEELVVMNHYSTYVALIRKSARVTKWPTFLLPK